MHRGPKHENIHTVSIHINGNLCTMYSDPVHVHDYLVAANYNRGVIKIR